MRERTEGVPRGLGMVGCRGMSDNNIERPIVCLCWHAAIDTGVCPLQLNSFAPSPRLQIRYSEVEVYAIQSSFTMLCLQEYTRTCYSCFP